MANFDHSAIIRTPDYSRINLTYESIGTLQMGIGTPVLHKTVLPGDDISVSIDQIMRLAPLSTPVFDDVSLHFRAFFVPNRILDPRWKEFITAGVGLYGASDSEIEPLTFTVRSLVSGIDESYDSVTRPNLGASCASTGALADWLNFHFAQYTTSGVAGIVVGDIQNQLKYSTASSDKYNLLPFLGYAKIFDDWYRNERLQHERLPEVINYLQNDSVDERCFDKDLSILGAADSTNPFRMFRVNYGKDRYTTALPEPVVGGDVTYLPDKASVFSDANITAGSITSSQTSGRLQNQGTASNPLSIINTSGGSSSLFVNLAQSAEATIRNLKSSFRLYDFFMKDTYGGNRYVEFMRNHFNVTVPDATLDRAIYLGDHKVRITFGEVFQTSQGDGSESSGKLGDYAGRGAAYSSDGYLCNEKFLEHGQLYVIASIVPRAKYFQGIDRKFMVKDRFDFFFPEFQDIGDDVLYKRELFNLGNESNSYEDYFGFSPRWSHLKESLDEVHGDFLTSLDSYHFGRRFANAPVLSTSFSSVPTINDPFSVTDRFSENYLINMRWNVSAARPVKLYEVF